MKNSALTFTTLLTAASLTFAPASAGSFVTRAKVVQSSPIIETVYEPYRTCSDEGSSRRSQRSAPDNTGEKLVAGILGGAAGSAVGKGSGRDAATAVGAVAGAAIADGDSLSEGEVIGGIVGGLVGNQVGSGSGKTAATGAGALIGAIVGDSLAGGGTRSSRGTKRFCETRERAKKVITGYNVTYEYSGVQQTGRLSYSPGDYVDINVGVELVEDYTTSRR